MNALAVAGNVRRIILGPAAADQCAVVAVIRSRRFRSGIAATASTTGAATSSAAPAPKESTSTVADETVAT